MEKFQFKIDYHSIKHLSNLSDFPQQSPLLYIFHADKIPPHIGWSHNNQFFSLKAKGVDFELDISKINHIILNKRIPTLIIELKADSLAEMNSSFVFSKYGKQLSNGATCLNPIDEIIFGKVKHDKIGNLIDSLTNLNIISKIYGSQLSDSFEGIRYYTKNEIENRIFELRC